MKLFLTPPVDHVILTILLEQSEKSRLNEAFLNATGRSRDSNDFVKLIGKIKLIVKNVFFLDCEQAR
jgi:hypothetical protein